MVSITKELTVQGFDATVDATNQINGLRIGNFPPSAWGAGSGTVLRGFTVKNALGEGILAVRVTEVRIQKNVVVHNDMGTTVANSYPECQAHGQIPGDCGEGLHLMSATHSTVWHNDVEHNAGGVLMTDEFGPANGNVISHNTVSNNAPDCGITIPSHNPNSFANGKPQPTLGGVFDNLITGNLVEHNGEAASCSVARAPVRLCTTTRSLATRSGTTALRESPCTTTPLARISTAMRSRTIGSAQTTSPVIQISVSSGRPAS